MKTGIRPSALIFALALGTAMQSSAQPAGSSQGSAQAESPWLLAPKISSDPKVGTSLGFVSGYLFKLDEESTSSMAGAIGSYSATDSWTAGAFLRSYWNADSDRFIALAAGGKIRNDYSDFLGSGLPASTTDNMKVLYTNYYHEVAENWFIGGQYLYSNYLIDGDDFTTDEVLKLLGLTGFDSGAAGLMLMYDTRDNQNASTSGMKFTANNMAFREALGGEEDFDAYSLELDHYISQGNRHVFAWRISGRWTSDAPRSAWSSVSLRGYTRGQYLAPYTVSAEVEQRWHVTGPWGINLFAGVTCLYGNDNRCDDSKNLYPNAGIGVQYLLKPSENMVITADFADGKGSNSGFYLRFGQAF